MKTEYSIEERYSNFDDVQVKINNRLAYNAIAELASHLIDRWGMVSGAPDGEDSAGRAKMRLLSPEEVVRRACDTAELAFREFSKRDWVTVLPSLSELKQAKLRLEEKKKAEKEKQ